jgi:hypothetical protein
MKRIWIYFLSAGLISANLCLGQDTSSDQLKIVAMSDSLKSGNNKDILTSFYQLALNDLASPKKELNFTSNPFAIMLKSNPDLAVDKYYYKYRILRKLNFSFGLKLDSSFSFKGFSSGIKYALIDQRDSTTSKLLFTQLSQDPLVLEIHGLQRKLLAYVEEHFPGPSEEKKEFVAEMNKWETTPFNEIKSPLLDILLQIANENRYDQFLKLVKSNKKVKVKDETDKTFNELKASLKQRLLWTAGISDTTYTDQFFFSNIQASTELLKGISKPKPGSNWEMDIKASVNFLDDTLISKRNLKRCIFSFEPGLNWVIRNKANDYSILEFKFSGSYYHNFNSLYASEKRDVINFNGTFRVRIIDDIWIPLEFKYDPLSGNVFGFINIKANFTGLASILKGSHN